MTYDARRDREGIALAVLIGVFAALVILLAAVVLTRGSGGGAAAATTTTSTSTTSTTTTTTTLPPTTTTSTSTTSTTTTTTTLPATTTTAPFDGTTDWKNCAAAGPDPGRGAAVRFAQREGFTRVVFDFDGDVPACSVGYGDPHTLAVIVWPIDGADPYDPDIFDWSGLLQVGTISVNRVSAGGMGAGSGEWEFTIDLAGTRKFRVFTLQAPSRVAIDIED